ncbi:ClbS/DfsB family four-helix bundle protein [Eubacteriales bacterium OttesenSCG-928-N13]|nr:ClbS/DfsB family four-helix bundle protein [Eubacteriales bacterium OttesenSCG-928-N13]
MPRPTNKPQLLEAAQDQFDKLWTLIDGMTEQDQQAEFLFEDRDRNVRDVLIHLYEWHQLMLRFVKANQSGDVQPFLPAPYNWKTYGDMNVGFWQQHQATPYGDARRMLMNSHQQVMAMIDTFTDEQLFTKKHFSWTGTTSLGSYCVSVTSSHYDWAMKKIKRQIKALKEA